MKKQIIASLLIVLTSLTTYGQNVNDQFEIDGYTYKISSLGPNEVEIVDYTGTATEIDIPSMVNHQSTDYDVTVIGQGAFIRKNLTRVTIGENVTSIEREAFAFQTGQITEVTIRATAPPSLGDAFSNRNGIDVIVPQGSKTAYENHADWNHFRSISDGTFEIDGYNYNIISRSSKEVEITNYTGTSKEVTILQTVTHINIEYKVTSIANNAFDNKQLTQVTFTTPSNVTHIGKDAFFRNELTSIVIPESVTSIGQRAFGSNHKMTTVTLPKGLTLIDKWTFAQCRGLMEVTIPASVEHIEEQAFYRALELSKVTLQRNPPTTVHPTAFQDAGFYVAGGIDLVVPFGTMEVYENAGWMNLSEFGTISSGITTIDKIKYGIIDTPNEVTLIGHVGVGFNLIIPPTVDIGGNSYPVTTIADSAFLDPGSLALPLTVIIPETVKRIGSRAFHARNINRVTVAAHEPPTLAADAFLYPYRHDKIKVIVPKGRVQAYKAAGWTGFNDIFSLIGQKHNNSGFIWEVTSVSPNEVRLKSYVGLNKVPTGGHVEIPSEVQYLPNSEDDNTYTVTAIGDYAMWNADSRGFTGEESVDRTLNTVRIPESVTHIGNGAFQDNQLESIEIPEGVTGIGHNAFAQNQLTEVDIPDKVTWIGNHAFTDNQLTKVEISDKATWIGQHAFSRNNLTEVEIPESVTYMGESAFAQNQLTSVTTPANVKKLERWVFERNQLTEVTISGNVEDIALYAFLDNPALHLVTMEANDPPVLHKDAFSNAYQDQIDLVVPIRKRQAYLANGWDGFKSISYGTFIVDGIKYGITSRIEVMVVDFIGKAAEVTIPQTVHNDLEAYDYTVTAIGEGAFQNKELTKVQIPVSVTSIGQNAFSDNLLTEVTIPGNVDSIGFHAFYHNPDLSLVIAEANDPPVLDETAFAKANRHQIDLVVPKDKIQAYEDNGWGGFRSISNGKLPPPRPVIQAPQTVDVLEPFTVNITFDREVTDFGLDDIKVTNATVIELTGSGSTYTATTTPTSLCDGSIIIDVPANVAVSVNHSPNLAAPQVSIGVVGTCEPPEFTIEPLVDVALMENNPYTSVTPVISGDTPKGSVTWTLGGADADDFSIDGSTGVVTMVARDYKAPTDSNADNVYEVSITATDSENNSSGETSWTVTVQKDVLTSVPSSSPMIPTAFTPNGDGANDVWIIDDLSEDASVRIYDRHGTTIFSSDSGYKHPWDGTSRGSSLPAGSYLYLIINGSHKYTGTVTILL